MRNKKIIIKMTAPILITIYKGHLPIGWGHLEAEGGKTWLGVAIAEGYTHKGYGTKIVKALCKYADKGGWTLYLTCNDKLKSWYEKFGFKLFKKDKVNYMKRKSG